MAKCPCVHIAHKSWAGGPRNNWPGPSLGAGLLLLVARKGAKFDVINASLPNRKLLAGRLSPSCFEFLPSLLLLDTSIWLVCIYKNPIVIFGAIKGADHSQTVSRWKCPLVGQFAGRIGREEPFKRQMLYELFFEKLYKVYQITKMVHYIDNCKWIFFSKSKNQLLG